MITSKSQQKSEQRKPQEAKRAFENKRPEDRKPAPRQDAGDSRRPQRPQTAGTTTEARPEKKFSSKKPGGGFDHGKSKKQQEKTGKNEPK